MTAAVNIVPIEDHWEIIGIELDLIGDVPGITEEKFQELAGVAKLTCPVSRALKAVPITLTAKLK